MKEAKNLRELTTELHKIKSVVARARYQIRQNEKALKKKDSDASVFIKYKIRFEGLNFIDALNAWKEKEKEQKQ